jgi:hypothetical protein
MYANKKRNVIISCVGIVLFAIIITAAAAASIVLESGIINVSYAQVLQRLPSTGSKVTTPGANPMCDPTDRNVNTTESHVCGIPKTPSATGATPESTTTEPPGSVSPSSPGSTTIFPQPPSGTQESPIPGLPGLPGLQ